MATAFMPMPPAGSYPWQQQQQAPYPTEQNYYPQQQSYSPPQQNFYPQPQYQQQYPPQQYQGPSQYPQQSLGPQPGRATPPQGWANHAGEYMGPGYKYNSYTDDDTPDYNSPSQPQYGIPESKRGEAESKRSRSGSNHTDSRFVFPENNGEFQGQPGEVGPDGERGLGATVLGGGAGAFLGHKIGHGAIGTIGGLAIGAIAANAFEHHEKKKKEERRQSRAFDEGYEDGEGRSHHHSQSRDLDEDEYDEDRPRHHSRSRALDEEEYYRDDRYEEGEEYRPRHHHHHQRDYDDDYYRQDDDYREEYYDRRDGY